MVFGGAISGQNNGDQQVSPQNAPLMDGSQTTGADEHLQLNESSLWRGSRANLRERGTVDLVAPVTALGFRHRAGDLRNFAAECGADFVVEGSLRPQGNHLEIAVWLVDGHTGITRRSTRIVEAGPAEAAAAVVSWLLEAGAVESHETSRG